MKHRASAFRDGFFPVVFCDLLYSLVPHILVDIHCVSSYFELAKKIELFRELRTLVLRHQCYDSQAACRGGQ
jgi:hypothetical protein